MNKLTIIAFFLVLLGCSPKISQHVEQNRYIRNYNIHIINDALQLYLKTPAVIIYVTDKQKLKKAIRQAPFKIRDRVLVYGKTDDPPYEFFITIGKSHHYNYPKDLVVLDTVINNQTIRLIGNPLAQHAKRNLDIDLNNIFKSLEVAPTYRKDIITVFDIVEKYQNSNKYYAALNEITGFPVYDEQEAWTKRQMALTFSSFLGKNELYEDDLFRLESAFQPNDTISRIIRKKSVVNAAVIDTIIHQAKNHTIIMINENHYYPNHRTLVSDVLPKLKEIGYNYLALEALNPKQDSVLNLPNAYPTLETGFYTREQHYANLIRKAKALGFRFVAYENEEDNKNREIGQAENIYNKTFSIDPNCKVVVLAGIDHILEKSTGEGEAWMATIFKNKYHIDPLTISQTHLNAYRNQLSAYYGIFNSDFFTHERLTAVDYLVLNNNTNPTIGPFPVSQQYKNNTEHDVQIALFFGNEIKNKYDYADKVPYFTTLVKSGKTTELPIDEKQAIHLYTFDKLGKCLDQQIIAPRQRE